MTQLTPEQKIDMLSENMQQMQKQLQEAYVRIAELREELNTLRYGEDDG